MSEGKRLDEAQRLRADNVQPVSLLLEDSAASSLQPAEAW